MTEPLRLETIVVLAKLTNGKVAQVIIDEKEKLRLIKILEDDAYPGKIKITPVNGIEIN